MISATQLSTKPTSSLVSIFQKLQCLLNKQIVGILNVPIKPTKPSRLSSNNDAIALLKLLPQGKMGYVYFVIDEGIESLFPFSDGLEKPPLMLIRKEHGSLFVKKEYDYKIDNDPWELFEPDKDDFFFATSTGRIAYVPLSLIRLEPTNKAPYLEKIRDRMPAISSRELFKSVA